MSNNGIIELAADNACLRTDNDDLRKLLRIACEALEDANAKLRISDYPSDWGVAERCDAALTAIYAKFKP